MLLARRTAALEARKGASALGSSPPAAAAAAAAAGLRHRDLTEGPGCPRPLPAKECVRSALLHTLATPVDKHAAQGGGVGVGRVFNRLKVSGGDAPGSGGIRILASAAGLARRKSTAAALMDESEADLLEGSAVGSQGEDGDGGRLTSFRLTGERTGLAGGILVFFTPHFAIVY